MSRVARSYLVSLAVAVAATIYALWHNASTLPLLTLPLGIKPSSRAPLYYFPTDDVSRLEHVQDAFARAGYRLVMNSNYSDDWHTMWSFHNPFWDREQAVNLPAAMMQLKSHQMVNQLPGASHFTNKVDLAEYAKGLSFIPKSFLLPKEFKKWMQYHKRHPEGHWVKKTSQHRGVHIINLSNASSLQEESKDVIVQEFIRPYLIDNRMFDVGIYIAITSVNPLRMYTFDNILVRACKHEWEEDLSAATRGQYVVADDYMPPWAMASFRPFYTWGMSTLNVLRAFFYSQGLDFDEAFDTMKANILELMGVYVDRMERMAGKYPHGQRSFYSMYRVDFILDRQLKPWMTEVSPF